MPILSPTRVIELLGLDSTDTTLIPLIQSNTIGFQNWITDFLKNWFHTEDWINASTISFSGQVITDSDSGFITAELSNDMDVHIQNSKRNDGIFRVRDAVAATLTLDDEYHTDDFNTETAANSIRITRIHWPVGMELPSAKMIGIDIQNTRGIVEASVDVDDLEKYPEGLLDKFNPWKKWGFQAE